MTVGNKSKKSRSGPGKGRNGEASPKIDPYLPGHKKIKKDKRNSSLKPSVKSWQGGISVGEGCWLKIKKEFSLRKPLI